jgi:hypothetical protein
MAEDAGRNGGREGGERQLQPAPPQVEVRVVKEFGGSGSWPMLTRTNYGEWATQMKWKQLSPGRLCSRWTISQQ